MPRVAHGRNSRRGDFLWVDGFTLLYPHGGSKREQFAAAEVDLELEEGDLLWNEDSYYKYLLDEESTRALAPPG